ncbi:hypothetical protein [Glaciibacter sp. 2TAF33]|uniref:hypothetical protein n=1 Tax=Glaciibacter sp. 2TAF33 TaxID=3233015 RepID=UPI003F904206
MTPASTATGVPPEWTARGHVDRAALCELLAALGGDAVALARFTRDFIALWGSRSERLAAALAQADADEAHVVLLSIRSTSVMLGAVRLEAVAAGLHGALSFGDFDGCRGQLADLADAGAVTCEELADLFPEVRAAA